MIEYQISSNFSIYCGAFIIVLDITASQFKSSFICVFNVYLFVSTVKIRVTNEGGFKR